MCASACFVCSLNTWQAQNARVSLLRLQFGHMAGPKGPGHAPALLCLSKELMASWVAITRRSQGTVNADLIQRWMGRPWRCWQQTEALSWH